MIPVSIREEKGEGRAPRFRAIAGRHQSLGRTAGEALDSLLAQEGEDLESSAILVHRFAPDAFFTREQYDRMQELLERKATLTPAENDELDALIDAELDATIARSNSLLRRKP